VKNCTIIFIIFLSFLNQYSVGQKLLRSTYSECYNKFQVDPNVSKITSDFGRSNRYLFVSFKNGDKYKLTFTNFGGEKLYGIQLTCSTNDKTDQRFNQEIINRNATKQDANNYYFVDEKNRKIFLVLQQDDFGNKTIIWEASLPFEFD